MKIAILAENYAQYREFVKHVVINEPKNNEYFYIDIPDRARGCRFDEYRIIGTFWERDDAFVLEKIVRSRII